MDMAFILRAAGAQAASGDLAGARRLLHDAIARQPGAPELHRALGQVCQRAGDAAEAAGAFERAVALAPGVPGLRAELARALTQAERYADAAGHLVALHAGGPANLDLAAEAARVCLIADRPGDAWRVLRETGQARPDDPQVVVRHTDLAIRAGEVDQAVGVAREGVARFPESSDALLQLCVALAFADGVDADEHAALHRRLGEMFRDAVPPTGVAFTNAPDPDRPLHVAFWSTDFRTHACAYFLRALLANLDPARVRVHCYALNEPDESTGFFSSRWVYRAMGDLGVEEIREIARADGIDALVDCAGWSRGHRMDAIAHPIAPVQAAWLGYSNTCGVPGVHYRFIDAVTDPPGAERWATERLVRLDACYLAYEPAPFAARGAAWTPLAKDPGAPFTFGCFNRTEKIQHATCRAWAAILAQTPGAALLLNDHRAPGARGAVARRFRAAGGDPARLRWTPFVQAPGSHLAAHRHVDLALDPFPYNGTTTTCEALVTGTPVLALAGEVHRARVGASLLAACGLHDLVTPDVESYVRAGVALAHDPARLHAIRGVVRERFFASPVSDFPGFARRFEAALRACWRAWCETQRGG
ncbi:MAG: tetratricopeptide repeat protein [Planctomycetota bacterium]|nr:tetratricopeptide repeat protein [Planctomycetota bacterium]